MLDTEHLLATSMAILLVAICVTIHYEALSFLSRRAFEPGRHRWLVLGTMYGALLAHILEIWIFAFGYWVAVHMLASGEILPINDAFDYVYFSAMVYTTVGFGDLVPVGAVRMLVSTEALLGLAMITWSASFAYLQMQRIWRD